MSYLAPFIELIASMIYLALLVWTVKARIKILIKANLFIYFLFLFIWQIAGLGIVLAGTEKLARPFYKVFLLVSPGFAYVLFPLSAAVLGQKRAGLITGITLAIYAGTVAVQIPMDFIEYFYIGKAGFYLPVMKNSILFANLPLVLFFILGIANILLHRKRETSALKRNRISYILSAGIIIFIGLFANVTPLIDYPVDVVCTLISSLLLGEGILRYRILNIRKTFYRVTLYLLGVTAMIGLLLFSSYIFSLLTGLAIPFIFNIPTVSTLFVILFVILRLHKKGFMISLRSWFMPETVRYNKLLAGYAEQLQNAYDLSSISSFFCDAMNHAFSVKWIAVYLIDHTKKNFILTQIQGEDTPPDIVQQLAKDNAAFELLRKAGPVMIEEVLEQDNNTTMMDYTARLFPDALPEIIIPLTLGDESLGIAFITTDSTTTVPPDAEDLSFITSIADYTTNAIARAFAYEHLKQDVQKKETLLQEVHHRVKNNLQIISSLFSLQRGSVKNVAVEAILRTAQKRIQAISRVHEMLYKGNSFSSINLREYLSGLVQGFYETAGEAGNITFSLDIPPIEMDIDIALPFCLAVNELISNAVKHAFDESGGTISVEITTPDEQSLVCSISDNGTGMAADTMGSGLGHNIVDIFINHQLNGIWETISGKGTEHRITIPLS